MSWAERAAHLLETSTFRHASMVAFIFLLVAVGTVLLSAQQIDALLHSHVRDMILADVRTQERSHHFADASGLAVALSRDDSREREGNKSLVMAPSGDLLFGDPQVRTALQCQPPCGLQWRNVTVSDSSARLAQLFGVQVPLADGGVFFSGYDILPMRERLRVIPLVAGAGLFAVLLSSLAIGLYTSVRSMRRVDRIRSALRRYVTGERDAVVPCGHDGDEFDLLGRDINHVLHRVNRLMEEVKSVSSHLAHELRTPLTRMHHRLENLADKVEPDMRDDVLGALEEAGRIQRMFRAVLRIGEVEAGRCEHAFEWFDARTLLDDLAEYYGPLVSLSETTLHIEAEPGRELYGDRALLFQALSNLLENAIKYAPQGKSLVLLARRRGDGITLGVADEGPGIPASQRGQAVERFRRLGGSTQSGSGLGLALVNAIARLHGATLSLEENAPSGLLAVLLLDRRHWNEKTGLKDALKT
ncbi:sensor histidine kinase [Cupriavidus agavae]|uniref:histidine kinase n=1 Tax=Cupriavidus agavae TaxID=1001822 RepID=A0A4Q7S1D8_9BURK|nr:HAMP domain-containing sensor histidine kinase [Cupriavidus agavae]RZT39397.1 signal transduction histidine kinase [Cupriavidus agavae]